MVAGWRETTLGEICNEVSGVIQTGPFGSQLHESDYSDKGIPMVMPKDIIEGRIATDNVARVSPEHVERLSRHKLETGDIVYGRRGDIGRQALIRCEQKGWLCGTGCLRLSFGDSVLAPLFLHYYLRQESVVRWISNQAVGATLPNLNTGILRSVPISFPPLPTQRRIAGILSAYDELIENSQRRIKILESMARALYREWFVRFRFPGHESVPRVASPLGEIPQGWEVKRLADVAKVNHAQINARNAPEELHYIDISSVSPGQIDSITTYAFADAPGRARRIVQHGDVLWSCVRPNRRSHAQVMHPEANTIASTGFAVLTATKVPFTFLYFATTTDDFVAYLTNNATGAAYPAVTAPTFEKADLLVPSVALLRKFGDATISMAEEIHALQRQIQNLRRTRDLLLPRLLSGQIDVEALDHA
ncbi:MAG: restriction endonuclease subunit S [Candidatus Competibacter sp.]